MSTKGIAGLIVEEKGAFWDRVVEHAPLLMAIFANVVVLISDIRVYDYLFRQTDVWWKALVGSLGCAVPFILWEIAWQYNHTTDAWRVASLAMAGLAFLTSIMLGVADYIGMIGAAWGNWLLGFVVVEIGVHSIVGLFYYYNDPDVARRRRKAQARARMLDQQLNAQEAEQLLADGRAVLAAKRELERDYDPEDVDAILYMLAGRRRTGPSGGARSGSNGKLRPGPYRPRANTDHKGSPEKEPVFQKPSG